MDRLSRLLSEMEGRGYKAYKGLEGRFTFSDHLLVVDHVQGDPFADPSRMRLLVSGDQACFPENMRSPAIRRIALEDYLARRVATAIATHVKGRRGSGKSGQVSISVNGQQVLVRNAIRVHPDGSVEARIRVGLPAAGRRVLARQAEAMLFEELPKVARESLYFDRTPADALTQHIHTIEDQDHLRTLLEEKNLIAFIADDSLLPRSSGIDDRPMLQGATPFSTPETLAQEFTLPHAGVIRGMGIPKGVTRHPLVALDRR
ncbi:MAG: ATPase, partial [Magnetococcales bacterium]|nr:ATPase [Magnetococcales bacterium]